MADDVFRQLIDQLVTTLLSPASLLSVWSLLGALMIAVTVALAKRKGRPVALPVLLRAMFPRRRLASRSSGVDLAFTLFSIFGSSLLLGWAVMSHIVIAGALTGALRTAFGSISASFPVPVAVTLVTFALWLAYEYAYFLAHWLSHKWPILWAFHKVHHSAESLSPLTIFRVHPVDSIVFYNIVAVMTGLVSGATHYVLGDAIEPLTVAGSNVLLIAAIVSIKHLQHSHAWIAFRGRWGRLILSPAHHQIHHSIAPEHHDRNFGSTVAVFDWLAGTLHLPDARRQHLVFGANDLKNPHSFAGAILTPFKDAFGAIRLPDSETTTTGRNVRVNL